MGELRLLKDSSLPVQKIETSKREHKMCMQWRRVAEEKERDMQQRRVAKEKDRSIERRRIAKRKEGEIAMGGEMVD